MRLIAGACGILVSMSTIRTRGQWWWTVVIAAVLVVGLAVMIGKPALEGAIRARIESAAVRHGTVARIDSVHVAVWPWLRLEGVDLNLNHGMRLHADTVTAAWPGRLRLVVGPTSFLGPAGMKVKSPVSAWDVAGIFDGELTLTLFEPRPALTIRHRSNQAGSPWEIETRQLNLGRFLDVRREDRPMLDGGIATGKVDLQASDDELRLRIDMNLRGARLAALADSAIDEPKLGEPTDMSLQLDGAWHRTGGTLEIPAFHATVAGAAVEGSVTLRDIDTDPVVELALGVQQLDFAQLLGASGLAVPESLGMSAGTRSDLGSATIDLRVRGRISDPASLSVNPKIGFQPPKVMPLAIARLRGDFIFRSEDGPGPHRPVDVAATSSDFIALRDVPPLFVRTLLLAEDSNFYGHRGIDLRELPTALLTNWTRGGAPRGASTITQQLAKNLFLSRDKQLGRKLQELALAFLLESALGKKRILEIYLNIIEWGPDLRGLRPAAKRYFGCDPEALTPAQMAFLVSIIPGPIKYQSSFAHGTPGPGLHNLIDELLAKLRSVNALSDEDYRRALNEPIVVASGRPPG